jgi:hypothetical protein
MSALREAIPYVYLAIVAFSFGHALGWHRGRNYAEDKCAASVLANPQEPSDD